LITDPQGCANAIVELAHSGGVGSPEVHWQV